MGTDLKKILIVTSGQPSLNPRMVKEADALSESGYEVTVLYAYWNAWGSGFDKSLLHQKKWKMIRAGGSPEDERLVFLASRILHKAVTWINRKSNGKLLADWAIARSSIFLRRATFMKAYDLYIAHNLGALPAVVKAAEKYCKPCGFDAEDFHRYETGNTPDDHSVKLKVNLEISYLPRVSYITASSPLIALAYNKLFPQMQPVVVLNTFPKRNTAANRRKNKTGAVKLLWFSQTIGLNRGLQDIINALALLDHGCFELHIVGHCTSEIRHKLAGDAGVSVRFQEPIPPDQLIDFAADFDIGLALEPGFSINNDFALSNKLFTYVQAGLCLIASNTSAQKTFMEENPAIGKLYPKGDFIALTKLLRNFYEDRQTLIHAQEAALSLAKATLNWEMEKEKLLSVVNSILCKNA